MNEEQAKILNEQVRETAEENLELKKEISNIRAHGFDARCQILERLKTTNDKNERLVIALDKTQEELAGHDGCSRWGVSSMSVCSMARAVVREAGT